jgi:hypothetical protein
MSWKPYPKISQVFLPGLACPCRPTLPCPIIKLNGQTDGRTDTERGCRIGLADYRCRMLCQTDRRTDVVNLYIRFGWWNPSNFIKQSIRQQGKGRTKRKGHEGFIVLMLAL